MPTSYRDGTPQVIASSCCCTGTGTGDDHECDCECCPDGYWTEYTFTIADIVSFFGGTVCDGYNGTWTLKHRGNRGYAGGNACVWSTDEVVTDAELCEGDIVNHPFGSSDTPERWLLYCYLGFWRLVNAGTTVIWTFDESGTGVDFCIDGGLMLYSFGDTSACCRWDGRLVFPTETNYLSVVPTGEFVDCDGAVGTSSVASVESFRRRIALPAVMPCQHAGRPMPPPEGKPTTRQYYTCEAGHGTVCKCDCTPAKCKDYRADV